MGDWQSSGELHSPTPWEISPCRTVDDTAMIVGGESFQFGLIADVTEDKDAAFIIKACNSYDALVKALEAMCGYLLNAKIDLETGCTKATAIKTIEGGIKQAREVLAKVPS